MLVIHLRSRTGQLLSLDLDYSLIYYVSQYLTMKENIPYYIEKENIYSLREI